MLTANQQSMLDYQLYDMIESDSSSDDNKSDGRYMKRHKVEYLDADMISPFDANLIRGVLNKHVG